VNIIEEIFSLALRDKLGNDKRKIASLSHWIRAQHEAVIKKAAKEQTHRTLLILDEGLVNTIIKHQPPNPAEQADNFLCWIGDNIQAGGQYIEVHKPAILAIIGSIDDAEFYFIFGHLKEERLILSKSHVGGGNAIIADVTLEWRGWEYYRELKRGRIDSRKAFMAMQYDDRILDKIVEETFKPAVKQTSFELFRLVERPEAGLIDDRLRVEIQTSRFLIADLTHENAGAYWEAGYAEGLGRPVIYTCEKAKFDEQKTHFDTNHHLTIPWDKEHPEEAAAKLKATIRATLPGEAKLTDE
jgi:hypothetical protein